MLQRVQVMLGYVNIILMKNATKHEGYSGPNQRQYSEYSGIYFSSRGIPLTWDPEARVCLQQPSLPACHRAPSLPPSSHSHALPTLIPGKSR